MPVSRSAAEIIEPGESKQKANVNECGLPGNKSTGSLFCFSIQKGTLWNGSFWQEQNNSNNNDSSAQDNFLQVAKSDRGWQSQGAPSYVKHGNLQGTRCESSLVLLPAAFTQLVHPTGWKGQKCTPAMSTECIAEG